jgi:hypothetical protein
VSAQEPLLNEVLQDQYKNQYKVVVRSKGYNPLDDVYTVEDIQKYLSNLSSANDVALLFYSHNEETDLFSVWLVDSNGERFHAHQTISSDSIVNESSIQFSNLNDDDYAEYHKNRGAIVEDNENIEIRISSIDDILFPDSLEYLCLTYSTILISPVLNLSGIPWYSLRPFHGNEEYAIDHWNIQIIESLGHMSISESFNWKYGTRYYDLMTNIFGITESDIISHYDTLLTHYSDRAKVDSFDSLCLEYKATPLLIGNPKYSKKCNLEQLQGAEDEARYLSNKFDSPFLSREEATYDKITSFTGQSQCYKLNLSLKKDTVYDANFIYFATHAISANKNPMQDSKIYISSYNNKCNFITAEELLKIKKFPYSIVVLSACETGKGETIQGGIVGMNRTFLFNGTELPDFNRDSLSYRYELEDFANNSELFYSNQLEYYGAQNLIMSLWSINDIATKELMRLFADELFEPNQYFPISPLRKAILKYREIDDNPLHWAAFQSMGIPFPENWWISFSSKQ